MMELKIRWDMEGIEVSIASYSMNGEKVGAGTAGFEKILAALRENPEASVFITAPRGGQGGDSIVSAFPFADRYSEFENALGGRSMIVNFH